MPQKIFAHYFTPYPVSLDNKSASVDYYARNYLTPTGESGKHAAYGGLLRDAPWPRNSRTETNWQVKNLEDEIRKAKTYGIDGFILNVMSLPTSTNTNIVNAQANLFTAATNVGGFDIVIMPDMSALGARTVAEVASMVAFYGKNVPAYRISGSLVVAPFYAEKWSVANWQSFINTMKAAYGITVAFVPCFLNASSANITAYAPFSYGFSHWGNRSPATNPTTGGIATTINNVHNLGKIWMQPVSIQDERPNQGIYDEAQNTQNLRNTWKIAIDNKADWIQLVTWNDYSEGTSFAPSQAHGESFLKVNQYYSQWFRSGAAPVITTDSVYLTHRRQPFSASPTFAQTKLMQLRAGSSPARDTVEALAFLSAPATVTVQSGSVSQTFNCLAGINACTIPLSPGVVSASISRVITTVTSPVVVQSPTTVTKTPYVQDLQYYATDKTV